MLMLPNPGNVNKVQGDANLYLKGGEGSMSILKLFGELINHGVDGVSGWSKWSCG